MQFHLGMGTQTQTNCAYIFLSLHLSPFVAVPNNLAASQCTCIIIVSHKDCMLRVRMNVHAHTSANKELHCAVAPLCVDSCHRRFMYNMQ